MQQYDPTEKHLEHEIRSLLIINRTGYRQMVMVNVV